MNPDTHYDSSNPEHVAAAKRSGKAKQETHESDIEWMMSDVRGRRLMWHWLSTSYVFSTTYTGESMSGAFNEGRRAVGLQIMSDLMRYASEQYLVMQQENRPNE